MGDLTHHERLLALRKLQRWLDEAFRVPGTRVRFGWEAVVGLVPGAGDVLTALLGGAILVHAHQVRVPRVVQARMLINLALDLVIGLVPFAGDVADVFWKRTKRTWRCSSGMRQVKGRRPGATGGLSAS